MNQETHFSRVKNFIIELGYHIVEEDTNDELLIIKDEESGISNLIVGCAEPLLILEQFIMDIKTDNIQIYKELLKKNRDIIHGAFALDETGTKLIFRDTLQLENLDLNELEASINSLELLLSEYSNELVEFSKS